MDGEQQTGTDIAQPERDPWDQNTRIFCAEQIVVPLELPEILKAFTKDVIRKQPQNLIEYSAQSVFVISTMIMLGGFRWFAQMAEQARQEDPYKAAQEHFPVLRQTVWCQHSLASLLYLCQFQEMDRAQSGVLSKEQIFEACLSSGLSETTVESVFRSKSKSFHPFTITVQRCQVWRPNRLEGISCYCHGFYV